MSISRLLTRGLAAFLMVILGGNTVMLAGAQSVSGMAQAEARRRAIQVNKLNDEIERGYQLIDQQKAAEALTVFATVYKALPNIPLAQESLLAARNGYVAAGCLQAQALAAKGDLAAAGKLLDELLAPDVAPNDARVLELKKRLADPDRFPLALTAQHVDNVGAVQTLLLKAASFLQLGDVDKAIATYQDVLRIDPANSAARRGMENAERDKQKYYKAAHDHQRSKMLMQVAQTWEDPVPLTDVDRSALFGAGAASLVNQQTGSDIITQKLRSIIFPKVEFDGATLDEVTELLRVRSRDLDPQGRGISFVISVPPEARGKPISLNLLNVPMEEVLRYVGEMCGVTYKVDEHAVIFLSISERNNSIITRSFRVPPDFIQNAPGSDPGAAPATDPFGAQAPAGGGLIIRRMGAREFLEARGVTFPEGTSANYNASSNTLTVRNTLTNMDVVEMIVEQATKAAPKMAVIHVRMLEVNQKNLEELGFDWLMGGVGTNGDSLFFGGGSSGNGNALSPANYPFNSNYTTPAQFVTNPTSGAALQVFPPIPVSAPFAGPIPSGTTAPFPYGGGPITSGLRSGTYATSADTIDSLLKTGSVATTPSVAPGVLSVAGVFTDPQFQTVLRALSQKKGVDINASPSVTTKSGLKATAEITREFIYPTEFDPPRLPQLTRNSSGQQIATPTTPTAFEMRKTGVLVEVEPVISEDGRSVELTIAPEMTEFEGFVNYGSPIYSPASQSVLPIQLGTSASLTSVGNSAYVPISQSEQLITSNMILQPVFKVQKVTTAVKIYDGATVVLGGAKIQKHTLVEDKVPILGDLPFVGRMFKSTTKQTDTKNIIIFVTVDVIDPSGRKINRETAAVTQ